MARPAPWRRLRTAIANALARALPLPHPGRAALEAGSQGPLVALLAGEEERLALAPLLDAVCAERGRGVAIVTLAELPRWETRRARRAASDAEALLREHRRRLHGSPGLAASYSHRGVSFADLASSDLGAVLAGHLPAVVRRIEAVRELVLSARPGAVLLAVPGRDERRAILHACASAGLAVVVLRLGGSGTVDVDRADAGPRPTLTLDWAKDADPRPVAARLLAATRGRVETE